MDNSYSLPEKKYFKVLPSLKQLFKRKTKGKKDSAELGANSDANHTCIQIYEFLTACIFLLYVNKRICLCYKKFLTFTKTQKKQGRPKLF